jgi:hypothetical protein
VIETERLVARPLAERDCDDLSALDRDACCIAFVPAQDLDLLPRRAFRAE